MSELSIFLRRASLSMTHQSKLFRNQKPRNSTGHYQDLERHYPPPEG